MLEEVDLQVQYDEPCTRSNAALQKALDGSHALSFRCSAFDSSFEALQQPTIRVVAVIAEGVPEADTKKLIAYARAHNKILLGPATVGGIQVPLLHQ